MDVDVFTRWNSTLLIWFALNSDFSYEHICSKAVNIPLSVDYFSLPLPFSYLFIKLRVDLKFMLQRQLEKEIPLGSFFSCWEGWEERGALNNSTADWRPDVVMSHAHVTHDVGWNFQSTSDSFEKKKSQGSSKINIDCFAWKLFSVYVDSSWHCQHALKKVFLPPQVARKT